MIKNVIETTDHMTRILGTPNKFAQSLRDVLIPMVSRLAPFQHAFVQRLSELGIAYAGSTIVEGPGERYVDDTIRGGGGIKSRFLLVVPNDADSAVAEAAAQICASRRDVVELRRSAQSGITLVRPDGYVAYVSERPDAAQMLAHVSALLDRQTNPVARTAPRALGHSAKA